MSAFVGGRIRWLASALGAAVVVGAAGLLFRGAAIRSPDAPLPRTANPPIKLSAGRRDEMQMRDLAPLFLPTAWNAAPSEVRQLEPGRSFFERDAERLRFSEASPDLKLQPTVRIPGGVVDALADQPGPLALGIGRTDATVPAAAQSGAHIDVFGTESRDSLLSITLAPAARPAFVARDSLGWHPLEFAAAVDAAGLVGPLLLTAGSGVEEVDNHFRDYLTRTFRIGDRLPPGFYRIVVGP